MYMLFVELQSSNNYVVQLRHRARVVYCSFNSYTEKCLIKEIFTSSAVYVDNRCICMSTMYITVCRGFIIRARFIY